MKENSSQMLKLLLFLLMLHSPVIAQSTWRGMRFGMTEAEVRKVYEGIGEYALYKGEDYLQDGNQLLKTMVARVRFMLTGKAETLNRIEITSTNPFAKLAAGPPAAGPSLTAIRLVSSDLAEKYGKPVTEEVECSLTAAIVVLQNTRPCTCTRRW